MRRLIGLIAAALLAESAALACSCGPPEDPAEIREYGTSIGEQAAALVEAEALTAFEATRTGEHMRVVRTLAGRAPREFRIKRHPYSSGGTCDVLHRVGERPTLILFTTGETEGGLQVYRTAGLCTAPLIENTGFRKALIRSLNRRGERG